MVVLGPRELAYKLEGADIVVSVDHPALAEYLPEAYELTLLEVLAQRSPRLLLMSERDYRPRPRRSPLSALGHAKLLGT